MITHSWIKTDTWRGVASSASRHYQILPDQDCHMKRRSVMARYFRIKTTIWRGGALSILRHDHTQLDQDCHMKSWSTILLETLPTHHRLRTPHEEAEHNPLWTMAHIVGLRPRYCQIKTATWRGVASWPDIAGSRPPYEEAELYPFRDMITHRRIKTTTWRDGAPSIRDMTTHRSINPATWRDGAPSIRDMTTHRWIKTATWRGGAPSI